MEATFQFVDGAQVDRNTRKLIRSHVMKGKNAGRKLHRPSKLDLRHRPENRKHVQQVSRITEAEQTSSQKIYYYPILITKGLRCSLQSLSLPLELTPRSLKTIDQFFVYVIDKMYPPKLGFAADEVNPKWLRLLFMDEPTSHCTLACMETCNEFFFGKTASSPESLYHLSKTFALVKKRLKSDEALSDSTLGLILMLIIQEQIRKEKGQAEVHYEGLRKMIELRGGLCQLEDNPPLLLKICKTDITFALQHGRSTVFFRDRMPKVRATLESRGLILDQISAASMIRHHQLDPDLFYILCDTTCIISLLNNIPKHQTLDVETYMEIIISICGRLLQFHPIQGQAQKSGIEAVYHIGLTIFMMTSFLQYDGRQILHYDLVSLHLKNVLDRDLDGLDDDLVLWLLFIGGIWTSGGTERSWLIPKIRLIVQRLDIHDWAEIHSIISIFPWVRSLHDEAGHGVWQEVTLDEHAL